MPDFSYHGWSLDGAIDALIAYDQGATDSGVHDEQMRAAVRDYLSGLPADRYRAVGAVLIRNMVSEERVELGYGPEDVREFLDWLDDLMAGHP
jgi:hypothetical protein